MLERNNPSTLLKLTLAGSVILSQGCGEPERGLKPSEVTPPSQRFATATTAPTRPTTIPARPTPESIIGLDPLSYYSQLKNRPANQNLESTVSTKKINWLNYSSANLDIDSAERLANFYEQLAHSNLLLNYQLGPQSIPVFFGPRSESQIFYYLVSEDIPAPRWPDASNFGTTTTGLAPNTILSYSRVLDKQGNLPTSSRFITPESASNRVFNLELGQAIFSISSLNPDTAHKMQEIAMNTLGSMVELKNLGYSYDEYIVWAKDTQFRRDASSPSYPAFIYPENIWNQTPIVNALNLPK